jgi:hypothetical protein
VDLDDFTKRVGDLRKPLAILDRLRGLSCLLAKALLFVERSHQTLVVQVGITVAVSFDRTSLFCPPTESEIGSQQCETRCGELVLVVGQELADFRARSS